MGREQANSGGGSLVVVMLFNKSIGPKEKGVGKTASSKHLRKRFLGNDKAG